MTILLCNSLLCRNNTEGICRLDIAKITLDFKSVNAFNCFKFEPKPPNQCESCGNIVRKFREGHHVYIFKCERCGKEFNVNEEDIDRCEGI